LIEPAPDAAPDRRPDAGAGEARDVPDGARGQRIHHRMDATPRLMESGDLTPGAVHRMAEASSVPMGVGMAQTDRV